MKTIIRFIIPVLAFLFIYATPHEATKQGAKLFLTRTNKVIASAQTALKANKVYKEDFTLAYRHQVWAKKMYIRNQFQRAVHHSRRARMLAVSAIRANSGKTPPEAAFTKQEFAMIGRTFPTDRELDDIISRDGLFKLKDEALVDQTLDLSLPN